MDGVGVGGQGGGEGGEEGCEGGGDEGVVGYRWGGGRGD